MMLGGHFPSKAKAPCEAALKSQEGKGKPVVLDIGTGSGAWAIGVAKDYREVDVIGIDLVQVNPSW